MRRINRITDAAIVILIVLFVAAGIAVSLNRYWQYDIWYYDYGIFARALWNASRFKLPVIDHFIVPGKIIFADHFNPGVFLLTPLFWLFPYGEVLLVAQATIVGLSGYVLYIIGKTILKNNLMSGAVVVAYFSFTGLQNAVITEFHELTLAVLPIMMVFYAVATNKKKLFYIFLLLTLSFKESLFVFGVSLSIFLFFYNKGWRKHAFPTLCIALMWGILTTKFIMPAFSGMQYYYTAEFPRTPGAIVQSLISPAIKLKTVILTFGSFLFLPLAYLPLLPIIFANLVSRFLAPGSTRWDLGLHYSAEIAPTLAVSTLLALQIIKNRWKSSASYICLTLVVASLFLYRFVLRGPFGLAYNPVFYAHTQNFRYLDELIKKVPENATVAAQNNLAPKFLRHAQVWILRENYKDNRPDYIVFDLREGQSPNNFLGAKDINKILEDVVNNKQYRLLFNKNQQYIFKRVSDSS